MFRTETALAVALLASAITPAVAFSPALSTPRAQEPSSTAKAILSDIADAQARAIAEGAGPDETAAAIAIAIDGALPDDLTETEAEAILDEVATALGVRIPSAVAIAIAAVRADRVTPPPPGPGAGAAGAPVVAPPPTPASGGAGDDSEVDPGYTPPQ